MSFFPPIVRLVYIQNGYPLYLFQWRGYPPRYVTDSRVSTAYREAMEEVTGLGKEKVVRNLKGSQGDRWMAVGDGRQVSWVSWCKF